MFKQLGRSVTYLFLSLLMAPALLDTLNNGRGYTTSAWFTTHLLYLKVVLVFLSIVFTTALVRECLVDFFSGCGELLPALRRNFDNFTGLQLGVFKLQFSSGVLREEYKGT